MPPTISGLSTARAQEVQPQVQLSRPSRTDTRRGHWNASSASGCTRMVRSSRLYISHGTISGEQLGVELDLVHRLRVRADGGIAEPAHADLSRPLGPGLVAQTRGLFAHGVVIAVIDMGVIVR